MAEDDFAVYIHVCYYAENFMSMAACSLQIAVDSIENIHTVAALGVEENFFRQYKKNVEAPYK